MWLARIEPDEPDRDKRTFECPACDAVDYRDRQIQIGLRLKPTMFETVAWLLVGFALGFGVRAIMSRRRHAEARRRAQDASYIDLRIGAIDGTF